MAFHKFIKTKGEGAKTIGYFVPRMYRYDFWWKELKLFGFTFVKERLAGWHIWWVENEKDYADAVKTLKELQKTHLFTYMVSNW